MIPTQFLKNKLDQEEVKPDDAPILTESDEEDNSRQIKPTKRHINLIERKILRSVQKLTC